MKKIMLFLLFALILFFVQLIPTSAAISYVYNGNKETVVDLESAMRYLYFKNGHDYEKNFLVYCDGTNNDYKVIFLEPNQFVKNSSVRYLENFSDSSVGFYFSSFREDFQNEFPGHATTIFFPDESRVIYNSVDVNIFNKDYKANASWETFFGEDVPYKNESQSIDLSVLYQFLTVITIAILLIFLAIIFRRRN